MNRGCSYGNRKTVYILVLLCTNYNSILIFRYHPVILTGDFNVSADSILISLLSDGILDCSKITKKQEGSQSRELSLPTELLQEALHISESCQYLDVVDARKKGLGDPRATKVPVIVIRFYSGIANILI